MTAPAVSVIIPTYNRAHTLGRAIASIACQTVSDWELIVVDDGSTDGTQSLLNDSKKKLADRLVVIHQPNRGCSAARNRGIEMSRGRFVAFLDSDDEFVPRKLERQLDLFDFCPHLNFVYSDYSFVNLDRQYAASAWDAKFPLARTVPRLPVAPGLYKAGESLFEALLRGYFVATIVGLVRREALKGVRFHESLSYAEEWLFYLRLAQHGRAGFVDEPLAIHHFTPNSLTRTAKIRNLVGQCQLFLEMKRQFHDLPASQVGIINGHLSDSHKQLARHWLRNGQPLRALLPGTKAFYYSSKAGRGGSAIGLGQPGPSCAR